jgi:hypothetical protein
MAVRTLILCDVDDVLRPGKQPMALDLIQLIFKVRTKNIHVGMITGGAFSQLPNFPVDLAFAESGGVMRLPGGCMYVVGNLNGIIAGFDQYLGVNSVEGWQEPPVGGVILDCLRFSSRGFLFGRPPHYPGLHAAASYEDFLARASEYVFLQAPHLSIVPGTANGYRWFDVVSTTKEKTVLQLMEGSIYGKIYYLGDGNNDLAAMQLPDITPVGFSNSIAQIQEIARSRGHYIDLPGPEGGSYEFFRRLRDGEL